MRKRDFLKLSPREFYYLLEMHHNQKRQDYEIHRLNTSLIISSLSGKVIQPQELYLLHDNEVNPRTHISKQAIINNSKESFERMNKKYIEAIKADLKRNVN